MTIESLLLEKSEIIFDIGSSTTTLIRKESLSQFYIQLNYKPTLCFTLKILFWVVAYHNGLPVSNTGPHIFIFQRFSYYSNTMRTNLPKLLDLLIFCKHSLNFCLEFFIMIFVVTNQLNISKFLPPQICKL